MIQQRFPKPQESSTAGLLTRLSAEPPDGRLVFGDERVVDFLDTVSRRLLAPTLTRSHPELAALGFFLRRSRLRRLLSDLANRPAEVRVPRGLVFHIPPANVASLLVYPWALSMLAGNANVVRLPTRGSETTEPLLELLCECAEDAAPAVSHSQSVVAYGRDEEVTAALSAACRLRVLWGGDRTVQELRRFQLGPDVRDLAMADRCSLCAISARSWLAASSSEREDVVEGFYNDAYWYGQAACASPLTVCWIGSPAQAEAARRDFSDRLEAVVAKREPRIEPEIAIQKRVATYGLAAEGDVEAIRHVSNALAIVSLAPGRLLDRWSGTGTFGLATFASLLDLVPLITTRHQTMGYFGLSRAELVSFVEALGGRGIDRLVPIGEALAFEPVWDGYDLVHEFSKLVTVR
ncbi:MAG: gamma-glutamyl phosphate reductase [Catenulispora sp.]|nr:gamma-glutamyl phosphate reductase [Catenulispora sp.]